MKSKIYFISGPTAIGKSSLSIRLAKKINGIIVNADSMQVYSNLEILTARPSKKDHLKVEHLLYGHIDGSERYNVSKWCNDIVSIVNDNKKNQKPLIIVGGTGMYIKSLVNGIINIPNIKEEYKKESELLINKIGIEKFVNIIKDFDNDSLKNISYNDSSRVRRIWEVYKSTGITYTDWKKNNNKKFIDNFLVNIILFTPNRDKIYSNVNFRFEKMIKKGAIDEVKNLLILNLDKSLPIMRAHGVPEISNYLDNILDIQECLHKGQQVTRNYVKRQLTWWRSSTLPIHQVFNEFPNEIDEDLIKI